VLLSLYRIIKYSKILLSLSEVVHSVIPDTQVEKMGRLWFETNPGQKVIETPFQHPNPKTSCGQWPVIPLCGSCRQEDDGSRLASCKSSKVEFLPSKLEALSPSIALQKKKKKSFCFWWW
jgi:hypothetical protein